MIDIEDEVFDTVYNKLVESVTNISMSSAYVAAPASFPAVSLIEMSNVPVRNTMTQNAHETHASLMYEINVYSDKAKGKKKQAKQIAALIDEAMIGMGFVRSVYTPVPDYADGTIFRLLMQYKGVVDNNHVMYR